MQMTIRLTRSQRQKRKERLAYKQAQALRNVKINRCGSCDACCTVLAIAEKQLTKLEGSPCKHLCASGCGIYQKRPNVCSSFKCHWLLLECSEEYRPDNSGLLCFTQRFHPAIGSTVQVTELFMGAADSELGRRWIAKLRDDKFTTASGDQIRRPVCVVRFRPKLEISERPTRWLVSEKHFEVLEYLRNRQESYRNRYGTSPNSPCGCGSGIKFEKCHANILELVITE